jgi:ankyrin repeat protein
MLALLLDRGADPNPQGLPKTNPLPWHARLTPYVATTIGKPMVAALGRACSSNQLEVATFLLDKGVSPDSDGEKDSLLYLINL